MFYEEERDVPLVEVLVHVHRIHRIVRQPQGHLPHMGVSGADKTTPSRFVAKDLSVNAAKALSVESAKDLSVNTAKALTVDSAKDLDVDSAKALSVDYAK